MIFLNLPELYYGFTDILVKFIPHGEDFLIHYHDSIETISFSAVILSAVLVYWQVKLFIKDYQKKNERSEHDKSYAMAKFYAEKLLARMVPVEQIMFDLNKRMINNYQESIPIKRNRMSKFNVDEATAIFKDLNIDSFQKELNNILTPDVLLHFFSNIERRTRLEIRNEWNKSLRNASPDDIEMFYQDKRIHVRHIIADTFNDLEYFSMVFCSGLAVPDNVYSSLHQTFIQFVQNGYLYIARHNKYKGHEFYTHIIQLYNVWHVKSLKNDLSIIAVKIMKMLRKEVNCSHLIRSLFSTHKKKTSKR